VTAPAAVSGAAGSLITFTVSAIDPDGDAIASFTASGTAISAGGTFTHDATFTSGTFSWTTGAGQAGSYSVTFFAANTLSGSAITQITVTGDHAPVVTAPAQVTIRAGRPLSFVVSASDPDGDAIASLTATSSPATTGSTFTADAGNTSGTFQWTPAFFQTGSYTITFTATNALSGSAATGVTVCECAVPPVVTAPATVSNPTFSSITFTVTAVAPFGGGIASLTAAGTAISAGGTFSASAGNTSGTFQWSPTTSQAGTYFVTFTATDDSNGLQGTATTQIVVGQTMPARAFTTNSNKAIKLNSGKAQWCAHVEPVSGFQVTDIQLGSVVLRSAGTGSVSEIPAITGKTNVVGDADNNAIEDAEFCFTKGNLRLLFSNLNGRNTVDVTIAGRLMSGLFFEAPLSIDVNAGGGGNPTASIAPNPLNPSGTLSFETNRSGAVRVRIFDGTGRLVRTILDTPLPAGPHAVPFDARDATGRALASGVYFYRVEAPGDAMAGRFVVAK
jgi:hypothetical protein